VEREEKEEDEVGLLL